MKDKYRSGSRLSIKSLSYQYGDYKKGGLTTVSFYNGNPYSMKDGLYIETVPSALGQM